MKTNMIYLRFQYRKRGIDELFNEVDTNGDGFLDQSEVQAYEDSNDLLDEWGGFVAFDEDGMLLT